MKQWPQALVRSLLADSTAVHRQQLVRPERPTSSTNAEPQCLNLTLWQIILTVTMTAASEIHVGMRQSHSLNLTQFLT